jgi:hypothetical protein
MCERYSNPLFGAIHQFTGNITIEYLPPEPRALPVSYFIFRPYLPGKLNQPMVQQRHSGLKTNRHTDLLGENVLGQIGRLVKLHHLSKKTWKTEETIWVML